MMTRSLLAGGAAAAVLLTATVAADAATGIPRYKAPKIFGTTFQADPKHDFTKRIHSRHDGILRGRIIGVYGGFAEYEPIKWKRDTHTEGYFVGPPEGDVRAYSSPIAKNVVYLSAFGCGRSTSGMTVNRATGLGNKRCSRAVLLKRVKNEGRPSLITVHKSKIVRVQEIYTP
ncbi:hypothetical protein [Nonomuraea cavernae]|uniref:hypothetical protein n=1 Tax=Nonomuraea cavernae TaxID=2045107 RepID=UPI0033D6BEC9